METSSPFDAQEVSKNTKARKNGSRVYNKIVKVP